MSFWGVFLLPQMRRLCVYVVLLNIYLWTAVISMLALFPAVRWVDDALVDRAVVAIVARVRPFRARFVEAAHLATVIGIGLAVECADRRRRRVRLDDAVVAAVRHRRHVAARLRAALLRTVAEVDAATGLAFARLVVERIVDDVALATAEAVALERVGNLGEHVVDDVRAEDVARVEQSHLVRVRIGQRKRLQRIRKCGLLLRKRRVAIEAREVGPVHLRRVGRIAKLRARATVRRLHEQRDVRLRRNDRLHGRHRFLLPGVRQRGPRRVRRDRLRRLVRAVVVRHNEAGRRALRRRTREESVDVVVRTVAVFVGHEENVPLGALAPQYALALVRLQHRLRHRMSLERAVRCLS
jgi:hypothetical protein